MGDDSAERIEALLARWGPDARRIERVIAALAGGGAISEVVRATGSARRTVEDVVRALGEAVGDENGHLTFSGGWAPPPASPIDDEPLVARLEEMAVGRPAPDHQLDHVAATLATSAARARFLDDRFALERSHLVFLGDHDLTSLAVGMVRPGTRVTVVDVDTRVLAHIASVSDTHSMGITTTLADLRQGLPADLVAAADLVVTDPPYSAAGVGLFMARGVQALREIETGRLLLSYGYGEQHPGLGFKVQETLHELRLVIEALLPDFNHYDGAEAIGTVSDLYVCRPTRRSKAAAARMIGRTGDRIYSKGRSAENAEPQS